MAEFFEKHCRNTDAVGATVPASSLPLNALNLALTPGDTHFEVGMEAQPGIEAWMEGLEPAHCHADLVNAAQTKPQGAPSSITGPSATNAACLS